MTKLPWKPWHQVVQLRPDLLSGDLSLSQFAADLYDVVMDRGTSVYRIPYEFFALTYPDVQPPRAGEGRGSPPGRQERQGDPPARADLRRRQDPHADHSISPGPRPRLAARSARRPRVPPAHRHDAASDAGCHHAVRQVRRREGNGGPRPGRARNAGSATRGACWRTRSPERTGFGSSTPTARTRSARLHPPRTC